MKPIFALLMGLCLLSGCQEKAKPEQESAPSTQTSQTAAKLPELRYYAISSG